MKAYEFPATISTEGRIELPEKVLKQLSSNQQVKIILLVNEPKEDEVDDEDAGWYQLAAEQFFADENDRERLVCYSHP
jgi:hypothetical protein